MTIWWSIQSLSYSPAKRSRSITASVRRDDRDDLDDLGLFAGSGPQAEIAALGQDLVADSGSSRGGLRRRTVFMSFIPTGTSAPAVEGLPARATVPVLYSLSDRIRRRSPIDLTGSPSYRSGPATSRSNSSEKDVNRTPTAEQIVRTSMKSGRSSARSPLLTNDRVWPRRSGRAARVSDSRGHGCKPIWGCDRSRTKTNGLYCLLVQTVSRFLCA
jgi:hypothetical protein